MSGQWASLGADVQRAEQAGSDGLVDDDVAIVTPWGFDFTSVTAPVLLMQGKQDRVIPAAHADWLHRRLPQASLWSRPEDGHISVLHACAAAMDWLQVNR